MCIYTLHQHYTCITESSPIKTSSTIITMNKCILGAAMTLVTTAMATVLKWNLPAECKREVVVVRCMFLLKPEHKKRVSEPLYSGFTLNFL